MLDKSPTPQIKFQLNKATTSTFNNKKTESKETKHRKSMKEIHTPITTKKRKSGAHKMSFIKQHRPSKIFENPVNVFPGANIA